MGRRRIELNVEQIAANYTAGMTMMDLAIRHDVSQATIRGRLLEQRITPRRTGARKLKLDLDMEEIERGYRNGKTLSQLAEQCGASVSTVWERLRDSGVPKYPRGLLPDTSILECLYFQQGKTMAAIGNMYGVTRQGVFWALHKKAR